MTFKAKIKAFRMITQHMYNKRSENDHDESLNERLDLLNRQNTLMEEIRAYKDENESLAYEVESKEKNLREANETVTILSLRINYMITQKFLNMIEKVYESIEYRHLNDAFDALIDEANENYEREEVGMFNGDDIWMIIPQYILNITSMISKKAYNKMSLIHQSFHLIEKLVYSIICWY